MEQIENAQPGRRDIAVRFLYSVLYFVIFELVKTVVQLTVVVQYVLLFITRKPSEPLRRFSNRVAAYAYRLLRYLTLNENLRPFPFSDLPPELEPMEYPVTFR